MALRAKWKAIGSNLALFAAFFLIAFAIGEFAVRLAMKDKVPLFPRYHTDAQYGDFTLRKIRPNSVFWHTSPDGSWRFETNAQGFRNYEDFAYEKPEGMVRVMSLGDSHTQGYEVRQDYTFSAIIERYLDQKGYETEVLNTGVSGFSTAEELAFFENEGIKYQPDFVVVGFYANDFEDNIKADLFRLDAHGQLFVNKTAHIPGVRIQNVIYSIPLIPWFSEHSYFYSLLFNSTWQYFKARLSEDAASAVTEYAIPTTDSFSSNETELTAALLKRLHRFCSERGIRLIILDIPRLSGESSLPREMKAQVDEFADAYIDSESMLSDYVGVAELHRPHGSQHITEFTHTILGVGAARQILSWLGPSTN